MFSEHEQFGCHNPSAETNFVSQNVWDFVTIHTDVRSFMK